MNTHFKTLLLGGLLACLLPGLSQAKPRQNCSIDSQEFVYVQLNLGDKLNQLQREAINTKNYDNDTRQALVKLSNAYDSVFEDAGKYGASHETMSYSDDKLTELRNAAAKFYSNYCRRMNCDSKNAKIGQSFQEMAILAVDEFEAQCNSNKRRDNNWVDKWNRIDKGDSAEQVKKDYKPSNQPAPQPNYDNNNNNGWGWNTTTTNHMVPPHGPGGMHPGHHPQPVKCGMEESDLSQLKQAIKKNSFDNNKSLILKSAIADNTFYVKQVTELLKMFSNDSTRVEMGKLLADRVCDCNNWYQVFDAFTFDSNKKSLNNTQCTLNQSYLMPKRPTFGACGMSDSDFNHLKQTVKKTSFDSNKLTVLNSAVPVNTFYMTQAMELMKLIDNDENRVTLGKMLYDRVCDRQNWYQIYNTFTFDSSKQSLASSINK